MKIYIAGSSKELEVAEHWIKQIRAVGSFEITHDWPADVRKEGASNPDTLTDDQRRDYAMLDLDAVHEADLVWFLGGKHSSQGMHVELGAALAQDVAHTVFSGQRQSIFAWLADEYHVRHDLAFKAICAMVSTDQHTGNA